MRTSVASALLLALGLADAAAIEPRPAKVDYTGFRGLRVTLNEHTQEVEDKLTELVAHILNPGAKVLDVVVDPAKVDAVTEFAATADVVVEDVGALLAQEEHAAPLATRAVPAESWFTAYHSYNDHLQFLRDLQAGFTSNSAIITAGTSVQGRTLTGIQIWGTGGRGSKPAIVIHGTVHAREWISTMTTEYFAWQLLTKYNSDASVKALVDKFDFYITPIVNPDGFVYTQTNDRLWRKNRQTVSGNSCAGRDINRNWPSSSWGMTGGASTSPCSETYKGQAAGDSPENKGLVAQAQELRSGRGIKLYLDIHSYGQYILWPYGHDCNFVDPAEETWRSQASAAQAAIRAVSGTRYTIGNSCRVLYKTTGDSTGYFTGSAGTPSAFTYELRDTGTYGFSLPASQIQPTVRETWAGIVAMLQKV
ncbi:hypothetical protein MAPG_01302 [Magnaporthiopsis poae ATCC 64411]|uniref:Peptidase M14 domain-containing protein n=1 Tax=Magnaporthiopsis poae (strain ATCC 64411 / 73-15) TaxID=644358 RepID=A0A0C4DNC1_MAGP6|nr:hypothetical protein MAPG_01302 [Magnaporthiopsis poae ATCC 64411]